MNELNNLNRAKTLGITLQNREKVLIKIPLKNGCFWEKNYFQNEKIQKVIDDFKEANNEEIPEEYLSDWKHKNKSLKMTDELRTLLVNEIPTLYLSHEEHNRPPIVINEEKIPDIIGKPFSEPFEVFIFHKSDKILKIQKYENDLIERNELNNFGSSSSYCNGNNNLFISGGEKKSLEMIDKFWKIDLEKKEIETIPMAPKQNHSMIYIPGGYVFIVGGNDKKTFYFDEQNNQIWAFSELNKLRTEPALILVSDFLYCFDNINSKENNDKFTFEKIDLSKENPNWEIITPNLDSSILNQKMNQKFFGVVKGEDNDILFLGGNMDGNEDQKMYNYKYNIGQNLIEPSEVPFTEYNFKEKTFLPYKVNVDYILPDFNRHHPEVIFYQKNKKKLNIIRYEPSHEIKLRNARKPLHDYKFNFNMPSISILNNKNINNIKNEEINIEIDKPKLEINSNLLNNIDIDNKYKQSSNFGGAQANLDNEDNKINEKNQNSINDESKKNQDFNLFLNQSELKNENGNEKIENKKFSGNLNKSNYSKKSKDFNLNGDININVLNSGIKTNLPNISNHSIDDKLNNNENLIGNLGGEININGPKNDNFIDISGPKLDINTPKINVNYPNINENEQNININTPNIKINNSNIEINAPKIETNEQIKINPPNIDINNDFNKNININGTSLKIDGPKIDKSNEYYLSGIINGIKGGGKIDIINSNINLKDQNNNNINLNGNIPDINIKGPKIDIKGPKINENINFEDPEINKDINGNIPNVNINGPKLDVPKANLNIKADTKDKGFFMDGIIPGINSKVNIPSAKIDINSPDIKLNGKAPDINVKTSNSKLELKKDFNLIGIIPGKGVNNVNLKGPNPNTKIDLNLISPKLDANLNKNINAESNIKLKGPNLPNISIEGNESNLNFNKPKINADFNSKNKNFNLDGNFPDINIDGEKIDIKKPEIDINKNIPGINIDTAKFEIPSDGIKIKGPELNNKIDLNGSINGTKIEAPKINVEAPKVDINGPNLNANLKGPNADMSGIIPGINVKTPKVDINGPNLNVNLKGPNADMSGIIPGTSFKTSNINLPSGNINLKGPEIKSNINGNIPKLNLANIEGQNIDFNVSGDKINIPESKLNSNFGGSINIKGQNPNINGKIDSQNTDINIPSISFKDSKMSNSNFFLSGIIPSKNDKNKKIIITSNIPEMEISRKGPNINTNEDFNIFKKNNKMSFHANLNDKNYLEYSEDIKGSRRVNYPNLNDEININTKLSRNKLEVSGNKIIEEKNVILQEPFNINNQLFFSNQGQKKPQEVNLVVNNYKIQPENNNEIKVEIPKIEINENNKFEIGGGQLGGEIKLNSKPTTLKEITDNQKEIGINIDIDGGNINKDYNINSLNMNFGQNNDNKISYQIGETKKKGKGLPLVGNKNDNFVSSKVDKAGNFDANNINIDNLQSANVGINGQKIGDRIVY